MPSLGPRHLLAEPSRCIDLDDSDVKYDDSNHRRQASTDNTTNLFDFAWE